MPRKRKSDDRGDEFDDDNDAGPIIIKHDCTAAYTGPCIGSHKECGPAFCFLCHTEPGDVAFGEKDDHTMISNFILIQINRGLSPSMVARETYGVYNAIKSDVVWDGQTAPDWPQAAILDHIMSNLDTGPIYKDAGISATLFNIADALQRHSIDAITGIPCEERVKQLCDVSKAYFLARNNERQNTAGLTRRTKALRESKGRS